MVARCTAVQGTADAVRQYAWLFRDIKNRLVEDIVILSGDHLYRMDYMKVRGAAAAPTAAARHTYRCTPLLAGLSPLCLWSAALLLGQPRRTACWVPFHASQFWR